MNRAVLGATLANQRMNQSTSKEEAPHPLHAVQPTASAIHTPLQASLSLGFEKDGVATRLTERNHYGPLLVQKPS